MKSDSVGFSLWLGMYILNGQAGQLQRLGSWWGDKKRQSIAGFCCSFIHFFFFHEKHQYFLHLKPQLLHNLVTWHWKWQRAHLLLLDSYTAALIITYLFIIENLSLTANVFMLNFMVTLSWIHLPQSSHYSWMLIYHNCQILTIMLR